MVPTICTGQHTIPSLLNKTLFKIAAMINSSMETDPRFRTYQIVINYDWLLPHAVEAIPSSLMERIIPQLSFQALKRLFGNDWTNLLGPSKYRTLLAWYEGLSLKYALYIYINGNYSIKNEEDVHRYLYYYNSSHPLLETEILLKVFDMKDLLTFEPLPSTVSVFQLKMYLIAC